MVYYTVYSIINLFKSMFGYQPTPLAVRMVPLQHANLTASPHQILHQSEVQEREYGTNQTDQDTQSLRSVASVGNGGTRKLGQPILRGSPKALGWTIDEEEEANAWVMLMGDALDGSVYERSNHPDEEDAVTSPIAPSNKDILRFFAAEQERGVSYVWRIVPSLTGAHQWTLQRQVDKPEVVDEVPQEPEVVRETAEMQTDTVDLVQESHNEMSTQTIIKSYSDAGVQVDEPVVVPAGALSPLPESTDLVDVLPPDLRPISPSNTTNVGELELESPTAIESRSSTPDSTTRIPRLASRQGSLASFRTTSTRSPSPAVTRGESSPAAPGVPAMQKVIRQASSIRSLALRRASSAAIKPPAPQAMTPAGVPLERTETQGSGVEKKKAAGRLFDAVKRIGRTESTVKTWKP